MFLMSMAVNLTSFYRAIQHYAFETLANSLMYHLENELSLDIEIIMNNTIFIISKFEPFRRYRTKPRLIDKI